MTTAITPAVTTADTSRRRPFNLGFHTRIAFPSDRAAAGLWEGLELFRAAERLGYDKGWVYQRHFDNYMAAPLIYLPVVAQHTERIGLGTAIIGMRYESPILMAEQAGTADLLADGRLHLGLGTGMGGFDAVFEQAPNDRQVQARTTLKRFVQGIRGDTVGTTQDAGLVPDGVELTVSPHSATLQDRVWYGAGSVESAEWVTGQGLALMSSTILSGTFDDYGAQQARMIEAYRAAHVGPNPPRTAISRSLLPATTPEQARLYAAYDHERRTLGPGAARPDGALPQVTTPPLSGMTVSHSLHGDPASIVAQLAADPALALADDLIAFLPPSFGLQENLRLIEDIIETVAIPLGWSPQGAPAARA
jgi:alkanesulfonate monooxygenase SsuD/methylene tetrahydromethanopterin reductase-like flavin-dependent oxidoreductase (luciferase family)